MMNVRLSKMPITAESRNEINVFEFIFVKFGKVTNIMIRAAMFVFSSTGQVLVSKCEYRTLRQIGGIATQYY